MLPNFPKQIDPDTIAVGGVVVKTATAEFLGSGLEDTTFAGTGTGVGDVIEIVIDAEAATDTFKWRSNGGSWTTGVSITGAAQTLSSGATVTFAATTGHTLNDKWVVRVCGTEVTLKRCVIKLIQVANVDGTNNAEFTAVNAYDGKAIVYTEDITADTSKTYDFGDGIDLKGLLVTAEDVSDLQITVVGSRSLQTQNVIGS